MEWFSFSSLILRGGARGKPSHRWNVQKSCRLSTHEVPVQKKLLLISNLFHMQWHLGENQTRHLGSRSVGPRMENA